jgi:hypothetical protein
MHRSHEQRCLANRLRAEGLSVAAIAVRLGVSPQRVYQILKPELPNPCRKCGGLLPKQTRYHLECRPSHRTPKPPNPCYKCGGLLPKPKRYHLECRPSYRPPASGPRGKRAKLVDDLTGRTFGDWVVVRPSGIWGKWVVRCKCGKTSHVLGYSLLTETSRSCGGCAE